MKFDGFMIFLLMLCLWCLCWCSIMVVDAMYLLHVYYDTIIATNDRILLSNKEYFNLIP